MPNMIKNRYLSRTKASVNALAACLALLLVVGSAGPSMATTPGDASGVSTHQADAVKRIPYNNGFQLYYPGSTGVGGYVVSPPGVWKVDNVTESYQWYRDGKKIVGDTRSVHTLVAADKNKKLHLQITGKKSGYSTTEVKSKSVSFDFELKMPGGPTIIAAEGRPIVGLPVFARTDYIRIPDTGGWPKLDSVSYQWKRNGQVIKGATSSRYDVTTADVGKKLTVTTQPVVKGFTTKPATSAPTRESVDLTVTNISKPKIAGVVRVGEKLTTTRGVWNANAKTFTYQWRSNGVIIKGATASSYKVAANVVGKKISVTVVASGTHSSATATSSATAAVRR